MKSFLFFILGSYKLGILVVYYHSIRKYRASYILGKPDNPWKQLVLYKLYRVDIYDTVIVYIKLQYVDKNVSI